QLSRDCCGSAFRLRALSPAGLRRRRRRLDAAAVPGLPECGLVLRSCACARARTGPARRVLALGVLLPAADVASRALAAAHRRRLPAVGCRAEVVQRRDAACWK